MLAMKMTMSITVSIMTPLPGVKKEEAESQLTDEAKAKIGVDLREQWNALLAGTGGEIADSSIDVTLVEV